MSHHGIFFQVQRIPVASEAMITAARAGVLVTLPTVTVQRVVRLDLPRYAQLCSAVVPALDQGEVPSVLPAGTAIGPSILA